MSFASPLMLIGVAAASVPLIIHLIGKRRAPRRRFAAIDFVLRSDRRLARRLRMRQYLLLAVRMLLTGGVALMMAKPFAEAQSELPAVGGQPQSAVLVLDDTLSMGRQLQGKSLFLRAKEKARQLLSMMGGQAELAVLSVSRPGGPLPTLTRESRKALAAIARLEQGQGHAKLTPALTQAARILSSSSAAPRQVFVLSDGAAHGITDQPRELLERQGIRFHLIDLVGDNKVDNVAVVDLSAAPSSAPGERTTRITARICNYGASGTRRQVTLAINNAEVARGYVQLKPWSCGDKVFQHSFARSGMHNAEVSIEPDSLPADDVRFLRLEVGSAVRVLLVDGAPSPVRHRDELFYLSAALSTPGPGGQPIITETVTVDELDQSRLTGFDVVALCNVRTVSRRWADDLASFVNKGGGLLVTMGGQVDPERFNAALGRLLPAKLRGPLTAAPPGTGAPALRIGRVDTTHPLIGPLWSEQGGAGLRNARFRRVYRLRPGTEADRQVIMWYEDGSPALVGAVRGEGRVLLFTSTIDRDWNDMPIRPGFLPLMVQIVRYLGRVAVHAPRRSVEVGGTFSFKLPPQAQQLRINGPGGLEQLWAARDMAGRKTLELPVPEPGFYKLSVTGTDGVVQALERESFMANINAAESDLRKAKLAPRRLSRENGGRRATRRVELWHGLGALLLALLLVEAFITRRG